VTPGRIAFAEVAKAFRLMQTKEDGILKPLIVFP
jgi:hypothetical protein